jgi:hypothetical protein
MLFTSISIILANFAYLVYNIFIDIILYYLEIDELLGNKIKKILKYYKIKINGNLNNNSKDNSKDTIHKKLESTVNAKNTDNLIYTSNDNPYIKLNKVILETEKIKTIYNALMNFDIEHIQKIYKTDYNILLKIIIESKNIEVINWFNNKIKFQDENLLNTAISMGDIEIVKYLLSLGYVWSIYSFSYGIESKSIEMLEWLIQNNCFWGLLLYSHKNIILNNNSINDWLRLHNSPWI